jgi:hypothetical protein
MHKGYACNRCGHDVELSSRGRPRFVVFVEQWIDPSQPDDDEQQDWIEYEQAELCADCAAWVVSELKLAPRKPERRRRFARPGR